MATNVSENPQDARDTAAKRINATLNKFRMLGNTVAWALTSEDREIMADAIEQGAIELVGKLRGTVASGDNTFSF